MAPNQDRIQDFFIYFFGWGGVLDILTSSYRWNSVLKLT